MNKKVGENKPKTSLIISLVVLAIIIALVIAVFIINYEDNEYNNENLYNYNSYKTYEEFNKEFSEYNTDIDISKNNYYEYEKDLFSLKYSSKIGEEHYYKKIEDAQLLNYEKNELYIFLTNNSDLEVLDAKLSIIYYDKDGNIIDTENDDPNTIVSYKIYEDGFEEGIKEGIKEGENQLIKLMEQMALHGDDDKILLLVSDKNLRQKMYEKYAGKIQAAS